MKCRRCQHENEAGAKFCEEFAAPLVWTWLRQLLQWIPYLGLSEAEIFPLPCEAHNPRRSGWPRKW